MADATLSDRLVVQIAADLSPLSQGLSQAGRDMNQFATGTVGQATRSMNSAFSSVFDALGRSVGKAAQTGTLSIRDMVNSILSDLARIAIQQAIVSPIENVVQSLAGAAASAITGRAGGGPVSPGSAYVVGERGPELFVHAGGGEIVPQAGRAAPQIVLNVQTRDAQSFVKSESQVAAMMTRALARGQRNL
jgi:lambda family phage tail tape measure protein